MQQHALVAVEVGIEPEPALGGEVHIHLHIGDQEAVLEGAALAFLPQQLAQSRARTVATRDPVALQTVVAIGRFDGEFRVVGVLLNAHDLVVPADVDQRQLRSAFGQKAFHVVLLQVHERGALVAFFGQQVELVDLLVLQEHAAELPRHALVRHAVAAAKAVEDFERALGKADGARAGGQLVVVVQQHDRNVLLRQIDGQRQSHRASTHHDHRMPRRRCCRLIGMALVVERELLNVQLAFAGVEQIVEFHGLSPWTLWVLSCWLLVPAYWPSSDFHMSTSRSAVQMRGSVYLVTSS